MTVSYAYLFFRYARWLLWLAALAYSVEYLLNTRSHMDSFNHLLRTTEFWMFALQGRPSATKIWSTRLAALSGIIPPP